MHACTYGLWSKVHMYLAWNSYIWGQKTPTCGINMQLYFECLAGDPSTSKEMWWYFIYLVLGASHYYYASCIALCTWMMPAMLANGCAYSLNCWLMHLAWNSEVWCRKLETTCHVYTQFLAESIHQIGMVFYQVVFKPMDSVCSRMCLLAIRINLTISLKT